MKAGNGQEFERALKTKLKKTLETQFVISRIHQM